MTELPEIGAATGTASLAWLLFVLPALGALVLFVAAMLVLVLGNNFVMLYLGWEGVGLASYLLIGFYQDRPSAATAAKKAFLMNRVGDVGLALAIFLLWKTLGTIQFTDVF